MPKTRERSERESISSVDLDSRFEHSRVFETIANAMPNNARTLRAGIEIRGLADRLRPLGSKGTHAFASPWFQGDAAGSHLTKSDR